MIAIYNKLLELLITNNEIRWIDLDKGQIDTFGIRPNVAYPCALVKIEFPNCEDLGSKIQQCDVRITIRLAFNFTGETSMVTPEPVRNTSLNYMETVTDVYKLLQGYQSKELGKLSRRSMQEEKRSDGLKVVAISFVSVLKDFTATGIH